jgi:hypothetical protein
VIDYAFLEILESFTRKELILFRRFIHSPYFNRSEKVVKLYNALIRYYPSFQNVKLTKENLHKKIAPELPYNDITMRRLLFDLQNLSENFVKQRSMESKPIDSKLSILEEYAMRGSARMHKKATKETTAMLEAERFIDSDYCMRKFRLKTEEFYFDMINERITKKSFVNTESTRLISGITYLISYFMLEAIKHNDILLSYSRSYNVKYNEKFINQFIELFNLERLDIFIQQNSLAGGKTIEVYLKALRAFLYFDNEYHYNDFRDSLKKHSGGLSQNDNHYLYIRLTDYCVLKKSNSQDFNQFFENELFRTYKTIIESRYFETESNKYIPVDLFRNIVIQAIKMKEHRWLEEFITEYGRMLHPERRKDVMSYCYALLYFERGAYEQSLKWLVSIKSEEFVFHLDLRNLFFKNYYELGQFDIALLYANSTKKFLNENKLVSDENRVWHENFFKYALKLLHYQNTKTKTDPGVLNRMISRNKKIASKEWLLAKSSSLAKSVRRAI